MVREDKKKTSLSFDIFLKLAQGTGGSGELGRALPETLRAGKNRPATLTSSKEIASVFIDPMPRPVALPGIVKRVWCGNQHAFAVLEDESLWGYDGLVTIDLI